MIKDTCNPASRPDKSDKVKAFFLQPFPPDTELKVKGSHLSLTLLLLFPPYSRVIHSWSAQQQPASAHRSLHFCLSQAMSYQFLN